MLKFWPTSPAAMDQLTPRVDSKGHIERNPFDNLPQSPISAYHPLLTPTRLSQPASPFIPPSSYREDQLTPHGPLSPGQTTNTFANAAFATSTTSLSLHAPDFNMQLPPSSKKKSNQLPDKSSEAPSSSSKAPPMSTSSSTSSSALVSKGQIHVKLIQARGLNVRSIAARPYVVVQFEQNEFISRGPADETDKEVKGTATNLTLPKPSSSNALNALAAVDAAAKRRSGGSASGSKDNSPVSSVGSKSSFGLNGGLFGRLSAHSPIWKHEVSL
jgi:serine/threonine protein kinase SCH9